MTGHTLIKSTASRPVHAFSDAWDPLFFECGGDICPNLPNPALRERYLGYLHQRVSRNPHDLISHVRRITLALSEPRSALVYESLHDLFVLLGSRGKDLRAGLLERCRPVITPEQEQTLLAMSAGVVNPGLSRCMPLVIRKRLDSQPVAAGVLDESRVLLENGQVELAQYLLEQALPKEPDNLEITRELLEIYRRSRNRADAMRTFATLGPLGAKPRQLWDDLLGLLGAAA